LVCFGMIWNACCHRIDNIKKTLLDFWLYFYHLPSAIQST